jgi:hypothetical protein
MVALYEAVFCLTITVRIDSTIIAPNENLISAKLKRILNANDQPFFWNYHSHVL